MREPKDNEAFEIYIYRMVNELYDITEKGLLMLANNIENDDYWKMVLKQNIKDLFKNGNR